MNRFSPTRAESGTTLIRHRTKYRLQVMQGRITSLPGVGRGWEEMYKRVFPKCGRTPKVNLRHCEHGCSKRLNLTCRAIGQILYPQLPTQGLLWTQ